MDNIKILFRLYGQYAKMDLLWLLRDTRYFLLQLVSDAVTGICTITGVLLLSVSFGDFSGMSQEEILFMMGYSVFLDGIYTVFFIGNNTSMVSRIIGRGQLDHIMIQPVPLWTQLLAQGFSPFSGSPLLILGTGLSWYGAVRAGVAISPGWVLLFLFYSACSCLIMLSFLYLLSCTAFYSPAAAEEIAGTVRDLFSSLKTYPLGKMNGTVRGIFLTLIPIGLASWLPSLILLRTGGKGGIYIPAAAAVLFTVALLFFKKGLKHYVLHGSPRYTGFGHR